MKYELKCYEGDHDRILVNKEFVENNKLKYVRNEKEILKRIENDSGFDFARDVLFDYLDWSTIKKFYKDEYVKEVKAGKKEKPKKIVDIYETAQDFLDYMVFGWMKAMDEKGLSASRTVSKLGHWLWLMGKDDLKAIIHDDDLYNPYGAPVLIVVCEKMGITVPDDLREFSKHKCN